MYQRPCNDSIALYDWASHPGFSSQRRRPSIVHGSTAAASAAALARAGSLHHHGQVPGCPGPFVHQPRPAGISRAAAPSAAEAVVQGAADVDADEQQQAADIPGWMQRTTLLLGSGGVHTLAQKRVLVVGLGGVGSFVCEFLARYVTREAWQGLGGPPRPPPPAGAHVCAPERQPVKTFPLFADL